MSRKLLVIASGIAFAHLVVSFILFGVLFSAGSDRFDRGGEPASWEQPTEVLLGILSFPIVLVVRISPMRFPALIQNLLVLVNSALWGFGIVWIWCRFKACSIGSQSP